MTVCAHELDARTQICVICGLPAEAIRRGRDRPATWDDVDAAFRQGHDAAIATGRIVARGQRRRFMALGVYVLQRRLRG